MEYIQKLAGEHAEKIVKAALKKRKRKKISSKMFKKKPIRPPLVEDGGILGSNC